MDRPLNSGWRNNNLPMNMVDWNEAGAFCSWAGLRLPTEAEWEYAARAGSTSARYGPLDEIAWYSLNSIGEKGSELKPPSQKKPNAFRLYDMLGSLWEWTADWYGEHEYSTAGATDPKGADESLDRVVRGGCWYYAARHARVSVRDKHMPTSRSSYLGFRCVGYLPVLNSQLQLCSSLWFGRPLGLWGAA